MMRWDTKHITCLQTSIDLREESDQRCAERECHLPLKKARRLFEKTRLYWNEAQSSVGRVLENIGDVCHFSCYNDKHFNI